MSTDVTTPRSPSPSAATTSAIFDPAKLPDDTGVLKQMIAELLAALKRDRRELAEMQQRLDALLRRGQPAEADRSEPAVVVSGIGPGRTGGAGASRRGGRESSRRGKSKPHGRRRPARQLRREPRRYELPTLERLCPECGDDAWRDRRARRPSSTTTSRPRCSSSSTSASSTPASVAQGHVAIARQAAATDRQGPAGAGPVGPDHRRQISGSHSAAPHRAAFRTARRQAATLDHVRLDGGVRPSC